MKPTIENNFQLLSLDEQRNISGGQLIGGLLSGGLDDGLLGLGTLLRGLPVISQLLNDLSLSSLLDPTSSSPNSLGGLFG
jgi:hypothetical protein